MPVLFVSKPGVPARAHRFSGRALIGREEGNDVRIADGSVSAQHALLMVMPDGSAVLKDLRSSNGCYFRRKRVRSARLDDGDQFFMAGFHLRYQADRDEIDPTVTVDWDIEEGSDSALITGPLDLHAPSAMGDLAALQGRSKDLLAL